MFKVVLFATAVLGAAGPAMAADFAGPRVEARVGWDRTTLDVAFDGGDTSIQGSGHDDGFALGAEVVYDVALSPALVAGAYAGAEWATTKECTEVFGNDESCLEVGRNLTLGARAGAMVNPQALVYVKGGYTNGSLKATYEDFADSDVNGSDSVKRGGFHVGVGGEYNIGDTGYLKIEAVRTNYKDYDFSEVAIRRTQIVAGFGLRF